jgi:hypothetical protein
MPGARSRVGAFALRLAASLGGALAAAPAPAQVTVAVDASANRHPIDPWIYGVAYASSAELSELNAPLNRLGGNPTSRYNWQGNVDNRGEDYFFESIPYASATPGEYGDTFVSTTRTGAAQPLVTIPMLDWVAKVGPGRTKLASFSIAKYGAQTAHDQYFPDAGNGILAGGAFVAGNDPNDANVSGGVSFQQAWLQHLVATWGNASSGGVRFYCLDNEPSIWFAAHRDVHPVGPTMDEMRDKMIAYAAMIKGVDSGALVLGPEEWGWSGYFYSGYDQQYGAAHGYMSFPDKAAHGNVDYAPYLLGQIQSASATAGQRLLDYFSLHYYPQGGEFSTDVSPGTQSLRNRSTRSLWDPSYRDTSWIDDYVQLIPRMKSWVAASYPGTKVALTEYNWGAEDHINGATAQADVVGILGREGVDLATRWTTPDWTTPTYKAMKIYRNYDGSSSTFGDTSVKATVPDPDTLSAFAAVRTSDGALTVMVISKSASGNTPLTISLAGFAPGPAARVWQLGSGNAIVHLADVPLSGSSVVTSVPSPSITLFVIPAAPAAGASYYTVTPCRVFDTRDTAGPWGGPALAGGADRAFTIAGRCGVPPTATAITANIAVTLPTAAGFLTLHPVGSALPNTSAINYGAGRTRANNAVLTLGPSGDLDVYAGTAFGQTVHAILDVTGYFQ